MIKYIGSKRRLVPRLQKIVPAVGASTALDLFTGTTRVAQAFKGAGAHVTAVDAARYSEIFARCYVETDADLVDTAELTSIIDHLNALPGEAGYVTETFCTESRFFQPFNGQRIDAIRTHLDSEFADHPMFAVLLTSLIEAADRVDSTTGVQMAYVKQWAPRSEKPLELRVPELLPGTGTAIRANAEDVVGDLASVDVAYLDPPYNQHRYFTNYHIWETLVSWDQPDHYGVACKRVDSRDDDTKSVFNKKREMPAALATVVAKTQADVLVLSYNDESWIDLEELLTMCEPRGAVEYVAFDSKRYVGAQIGIHNPDGEKVGEVGRLRNQEYVVVAGDNRSVSRVINAMISE